MSPVHFQLFHMHPVNLSAPPAACTVLIESRFCQERHETCCTTIFTIFVAQISSCLDAHLPSKQTQKIMNGEKKDNSMYLLLVSALGLEGQTCRISI